MKLFTFNRHGSTCVHAKKSIARLIGIFLFLVLISGGIFTHAKATEQAVVYTREVETTKTVYTNREKHYPDDLPPILYKICTAESGQGTGKPQHFDVKTGKVLRGKIDPDDVGACQIHTSAKNTNWYDIAREMGLDIYDEQDNYKMAVFIFENYGTDPWNSSKHNWK
jgi:hypothetical protein